jgi:hypothetical protein
MSWEVVLRHCVTPTDCHSHIVQTFSGVASGSSRPRYCIRRS